MPQRREPEDTILREAKTVAVVGLSPRPERDSHRVALYLQRHGYRIIPVNPDATAPILGMPVFPSLEAVPEPVDLVDVFRRSAATDEAIDGAIRIGARAVWLQLDITNDAGLRRARAAGLLATQDCCIMVEHRRWAAAQAARD